VRPGLLLTLLRRESRGQLGRLAVFVASLSVGVAAVVAVSGLSHGLDSAVRRSARELLAADVAAESRRPLPAELDAVLAEHPELRRTTVVELATLAAAPPRPASGTPEPGADRADEPGRSRLVELKVIDGEYPFYGNLVLDPPGTLAAALTPETAVCAPELLAALGLARGDVVRIGGAEFTLAGEVRAEPDRLGFGLSLGPRVFLSSAGLQRTELLGARSMAEHKLLLALPADAGTREAQALAEELEAALPERFSVDVQTAEDAQPSLRRGLRRVDSFLGLVALLSLLIGGIGVAQTVRAWLAGRLTSLAICKCLGVRPRELLAVHLAQTAVLGLVGSVAGVALGVGALAAVPALAGDLLGTAVLSPWQPEAMLRGLLLGLLVSLVASVPPLLAILRVPPIAVLRRDATLRRAGRPARLAVSVVLIGGVFAAAWLQSRDLDRAAVFTGGLALTAGLLLLAARGVIALVRAGSERGAGAPAPRRRLPLALRHGVAALARPEAGTYGGVLALGIGVLVLVAMQLVHGKLSSALSGALPRNAPSDFLVDIQREQWPAIEALLAESGATDIMGVPVVTARLASVNGRDVEDIARERRGRGRWALTREQRLTSMAELPADNRVIEGAADGTPWSQPGVDEVSLEQGYADELDVGVGSTLVFDVQGLAVPLTVTSVRTVEWRTFGINFFVVVEPGVLDEAPQMTVAAAALPPAGEQRVQDEIAARFPNVTVLPVREIVQKVGGLLEKLGAGVRVLGLFTVVAGLAILASALGAAALARRGQIALLKTLGVTRGGVLAMFGVEWALVGALAGLVGGAAGGLLAWAVLTQVMELEASLLAFTAPVLAATGAAALLACVCGAVASLRSLSVPPLAVLRGE
jgi:putative ABC transport system permease protein